MSYGDGAKNDSDSFMFTEALGWMVVPFTKTRDAKIEQVCEGRE